MYTNECDCTKDGICRSMGGEREAGEDFETILDMLILLGV